MGQQCLATRLTYLSPITKLAVAVEADVRKAKTLKKNRLSFLGGQPILFSMRKISPFSDQLATQTLRTLNIGDKGRSNLTEQITDQSYQQRYLPPRDLL